MAVHRAEADLAPDGASLGESDALPRGCRVDREDAQEASFRRAAVRNPGSLYFPVVAMKKVGTGMGTVTLAEATAGPKTMDLEPFAEAEVFFG